MPSRDLVHRLAWLNSTVAGAAVTTQTTNTAGSNSLDTLGYESITLILLAHTLTAGTIRLYAQDSPDGTTWGALGTADPPTNIVAATQVIGLAYPAGITAAGQILIGLNQSQRFVRAIVNQVGYSGIFSAHILLSHPRHSGSAV